MGRVFKGLLWLGALGLVGIQFVPVERSNPAVTGEISPPDHVMEILRGACYDCHSNETRWPWYSRVAPVSWWIARNVRTARETMNFSEWEGLLEEDQNEAREEIWEEVEKGTMPLSDYLRMHPEAVLTEPQREALRRWSQGQTPEFPDWD
jgi:hypothetical protein